MDNFFNNISLVRIALKWKWHLAVIIFVAAAISVLISSPLVITPKFKSHAILYPTNITSYSEESTTEQMLQWLQARDIMDSVVKKYNLVDHYKLDINDKHFYNNLLEIYNENVRISKTPFESVRVEVMDVNPLLARNIVQAIIDFYNLKVQTMHREKYSEVLDISQRMLDLKQAEIDSVLAIHYTLRTEYGLIDYGHQAREVARGYLGTVDGSNSQLINKEAVKRLKENLEKHGGDFILYNTLVYNLIAQFSEMKDEHERTLFHYKKDFTYATVVSEPLIPDKKAYPVRWLILLYSVVAAAFFSIIVIAFIENSSSLKAAEGAAVK